MKGRKPVSRKLKLLRGTFRPWRETANNPEHSSVLPQAPEHLTDRERRYFDVITKQLEAIGGASQTFTEAQMLLAQRLAEIDTCSELIRRDGLTFHLKGKVRRHPAARMRSAAQRHAQSLFAELGLSAIR